VTTEIDQKYERLLSILRAYKRVMVALSGGLDSSFLLYASTVALGKENVFAAIGVSASLPRSEYQQARAYCERLGLAADNVIVVETQELSDPDYRRNDANRCFFCKQELCAKLQEMAALHSVAKVCDGANASDKDDHRPGRRAAESAGVCSPLLEADLAKDEIRRLARSRGLEVWDKPQSACLASRIPYGSEVTRAKLQQIELAEDYLRSLGFRELRVRHHGDVARIELPVADMQRLINDGLGVQIQERFREMGFLFTAIDVGGLKSGSMNIMLKGGSGV
jgi:uncharacterized protein